MQCKSMKHCVTQPTVFIDLRNVGSWGAWNTSGGIVLNKTICFFGSRWSLVMLLQSLDLKTLLYMDSFHHKCILQSDDETCLRNWIYYKCIKCLSSSNRPHAASLIGDDERLKKDKREVGRRKKKGRSGPWECWASGGPILLTLTSSIDFRTKKNSPKKTDTCSLNHW